MLAPLALALFGDIRLEGELPPLSELGGSLAALAEGSRPRVLLPSVVSTLEVALVRSRDGVLASLYDTGTVPEVIVRDRAASLAELCATCAIAARKLAGSGDDDPLRRLAVRLEGVTIARVLAEREVLKRGGALVTPEDNVPLAFGFEAAIRPAPLSAESFALRADVHALLFDGALWAYVRGRKIELCRGAILLAAQRMVTASRTLVEARERGRAANVRLRSGSFAIGARLERNGDVAITLGDGKENVTAMALDVPGAVLPMLRIAADLVRALISVDRGQTRNLRIRAMRAELRTLRKALRAFTTKSAFVNRDPERLIERTSARSAESIAPPQSQGTLRFAERYRIVLDELDASTTFLCGDRIVASTPKRTLAIARDTGDALWVREGTGLPAFMAGAVLVRPSPDGQIELCDVHDGEAYAIARASFRGGTQPTGIFAGGDAIPPMLLLHESPSRIAAIDLRTGEPRFRFAGRRGAALTSRRAGRLLLVASRDGTLDALDLGSGEVVWRFADRARFAHAPVATREHAAIASGEPGSPTTQVFGVHLYSGLPAWTREIDGPLAAAPLAAGDRVLVASGRWRRSTITALDAATGEPIWSASDPGLGLGGAWMTVDRMLIVNSPNGLIRALDLEDGSVRWSQPLAHPMESDVPRKLEPVLRGGALFVPASQVHVLRPSDGTPHGAPLPCDLVPDLLRVDERGWVYVGEESGHLAAYAPMPHLTLVR